MLSRIRRFFFQQYDRILQRVNVWSGPICSLRFHNRTMSYGKVDHPRCRTNDVESYWSNYKKSCVSRSSLLDLIFCTSLFFPTWSCKVSSSRLNYSFFVSLHDASSCSHAYFLFVCSSEMPFMFVSSFAWYSKVYLLSLVSFRIAYTSSFGFFLWAIIHGSGTQPSVFYMTIFFHRSWLHCMELLRPTKDKVNVPPRHLPSLEGIRSHLLLNIACNS